MPSPLSYGAPIETISAKIRNSVRVGQRTIEPHCPKIGDEKMDDSKLVANAETIVNELEKEAAQGTRIFRMR